ncbi:MAG: hypothetical protein LH478_13085 [Chitinophagaceae bacterium]|nr:hypothetical protein [Chitinophagaceae bacterium]
MIINRHNYEEFFLLYVDNELTASEKLAVENFVRNNEDVAKEFYALKESVLIPGADQFLPKANLYKASTGINVTNCEAYFLLHVDNELDDAEKDAVEKFVLQHPVTQPNFTLLHNTRLEPEPVNFENKELLYKKSSGKIVWMSRSRIALAAMLAGVAIALYFIVPSGKKETSQASIKQQPIKTGTLNNTELAITKPIIKQDKNAVVVKDVIAPVPAKDIIKPASNLKNVAKVDRPQKPLVERNNDVNVSVATVSKQNNIDLATSEKNTLTIDRTLAATITPQLVQNHIPDLKQGDAQEKDLVKQTVYREIDTDADERDHSFLFGSTRINKNKLRGLFKKASGLFDKKADKAETDKTIQIASFEIKGK